MKQKAPQITLWVIAILIAARLTWMSIQHGLTVLDTATIALFSLYGARVGGENIARAINAARQNGAAR